MKLLLLVSFLSLWRRSDGTGAALFKVVVKEGDDAMLPCSFSSRNIRQDLFDWKKDKKEVFMYDKGKVYDEASYRQDEQFRGRVFHFPEHLEEGNASIVIRATKLTDSGNYTCDFPHHPPIRRSNVELVVGAAPKPSVTTLDETTDWAQLQCSVRGASPKPDVHWQNRAEDIVPAEEPQVSERGGSYDIILQTTVTKTDLYRCVSTQKEIDHKTYAETYVHLNDNRTALIGAGVAVGLAVGFVVGVIFHFAYKKKTTKPTNSDQAADATPLKSQNQIDVDPSL